MMKKLLLFEVFMGHHFQESIFKSTVRSFFKAFALILGFFVAIVAGVAALSFTETPLKGPAKSELMVMADAKGGRTILDETAPVLLVLRIQGVIGVENLRTEKVTNLLLDVEEGSVKKGRVKGILLYINSPGGLSTDSAGIYHVIKAFKAKNSIPVYAFVDGLCASGGMYIAAAADQIYATSDSIVGSIGARMGPFFNFSEGMKKVGISALTIADGKDKDMLNPYRPWKEGEDASVQAIVKSDYLRFVDHMAAERPGLDKEKLINVYGANVYDAAEGKEKGYIDVAGAFYSDAVSALAKAAKIEGDTLYQVIEIRTKEAFFKELVENSTLLKGKVVHSLDTGSHMRPEMSGKMLYLYSGPGY